MSLGIVGIEENSIGSPEEDGENSEEVAEELGAEDEGAIEDNKSDADEGEETGEGVAEGEDTTAEENHEGVGHEGDGRDDDADIDSRGVAKSLVLAEEVERAATEAETSEAQFAGERAEATKMRVGEP